MKEELQPAIEALKKDLLEKEQKVIETKTMINNLCKLAGMDILYPDTGSVSEATITSIQGDTFYGKSVNTAAREYLEMRKSANQGPASPRDVYEALKKGGFIFNSKSESNAITVVRNAMSKQSSIFHRLPTNEYGLAKWYDKAKIQKLKNSNSNDDDNAEIESAETNEESADE